MNRNQAKSIFESEIKDSFNEILFVGLGRGCSVVCDSDLYNKRSKLFMKSEMQEKVFYNFLTNYQYRDHSGKKIPATQVFSFLSETENGFDWIHNSTGIKISVKHSKDNLTITAKNCISNKDMPSNIDYILITTTGNYKECPGLYFVDFDSAKKNICTRSNSSKLYYTINYHDIIHYIEYQYTPASLDLKNLVNNLNTNTEQRIAELYCNIVMKGDV